MTNKRKETWKELVDKWAGKPLFDINPAIARTAKRTVTFVALGLLGVQALSGCSSAADVQQAQSSSSTQSDGSKLISVTLPVKDGSLCNAPMYLAKELGYFEKNGIDAKLTSADAELIKTGLANGTVPVINGDFKFFQSIENGVDAKVVDGMHYGCIKLLVRNDSNIKSAADLKGKKIATGEIGDTPQQVAALWLEQGGVKATPTGGDVTFLPFSDWNLEVQALKSGEVDMAALWDPVGSQVEKKGDAKVLFDLSKDPELSKFFCCFLYASGKVLKENPDEIAKLNTAVRQAEDWIAQHPEEAVQKIGDGGYSEVTDKDLAVQLIKDYKYPTLEQAEKNDTKGNLEYFAKALNNLGYLKENADEFVGKVYSPVPGIKTATGVSFTQQLEEDKKAYAASLKTQGSDDSADASSDATATDSTATDKHDSATDAAKASDAVNKETGSGHGCH